MAGGGRVAGTGLYAPKSTSVQCTPAPARPLSHGQSTLGPLFQWEQRDCSHWSSPPSSVYLLPAGMNMSPVSRLKKTWAKVKTAKFFILEVSRVAGPKGVASWSLSIAAQVSPCLLPAPDGPNREFLQLQDRPAWGSSPLADRSQQQGEGRRETFKGHKFQPS